MLSVAVNDHEILTGSADNRVRRYDLRQGQMYLDFVGSKFTMRCRNLRELGTSREADF